MRLMSAIACAVLAWSAGGATPEELVACPVSQNLRGHEDVEWSIGYAFNLTNGKKDLPRVLLVGDSICNAYQDEVRKRLEGKMNVSYWVSSYCVTSPGYLRLLDFYLSEAEYAVVHFNNGCHSFGTSDADWEKGFRAALRLIRLRQPNAKIVWATTTPNGDEKNNVRVKALNAVGATVAAEENLTVDDLYALMDPLDRATFWGDRFHFKPAAVQRQADQIAQLLLKETGGLRYENPVWKLDAPDPTVWQAGDRYYASSTHHDVLESCDLVNWRATGGKLLEEDELKWIRKTWPNVWAPDVVKMGEWYNLYICYHNGGAHTAIAVYRSKEPQGPFKDRRIILKSEDDRQHEVIDPEVVRDEKGRVWLFFGHGDIRRVELTEDGLARKPGSRIEHVAGVEWNLRGEKNKYYGPECATEGAYLHRHGNKWYLFVSQGGWNDASYQVAVGRADSLDGRFFDKQDRPMVLGHATKILGSESGDDFFGPGHNGEIFTTPSGRTYMFYHCHWTKSPDRKPGSWYVPRPLFLQEVLWDKDGWPYFGNGGKPQRSCEFKQ